MLFQNVLASDLTNILSMKLVARDAQSAGRLWGNAYDSYAKTGMVMGVPAITVAGVPSLQQLIGTAFSASPGTPSTVAAMVGSALVAYWASATVAGMAAPPVGAAGLAAFVPQFAATLASRGGTAQSKAQEFAAAFHAFTLMVVVSMLPSGAPVNVT